MGFLPSPDTDFSQMTVKELEALERLLESEHAKSRARQLHIDALLTSIRGYKTQMK